MKIFNLLAQTEHAINWPGYELKVMKEWMKGVDDMISAVSSSGSDNSHYNLSQQDQKVQLLQSYNK